MRAVAFISSIFAVLMTAVAYAETGLPKPWTSNDSAGFVTKWNDLDGAPNVLAKMQVAVRTSPPSGFLGRPGAELYQTVPDQMYVVTGTNNVQHLFSTNTWVNVAPLNEDGSADYDNAGWVYWGLDAAAPSPNFKVIEDAVIPE